MSHFYSVKTPPLGKKERIFLILLCIIVLIWFYHRYLDVPNDYDSLLKLAERNRGGTDIAFINKIPVGDGNAQYTYISISPIPSGKEMPKLNYDTYLLKKCVGDVYIENVPKTDSDELCSWYRIKGTDKVFHLIRKDSDGKLSLWVMSSVAAYY